MKPVTGKFLAAADRSLLKARATLAFPDEAGRLAYLTMFHAAKALIYERADIDPKTHRGVNRLFNKLARSESIDPNLPPELANAYLLKQAADYDPASSTPVTSAEATKAIDTAERFLTQVRQLLDPLPNP